MRRLLPGHFFVLGLSFLPVILEAQVFTPMRPLNLDLRIDGNVANLKGITELFIARDGRMIVPSPETGAIRQFDASGLDQGALNSMLDSATAPKRIAYPKGWVGDTLWVYDSEKGVTRFISPTGKMFRTAPTFPSVFFTTKEAAPKSNLAGLVVAYRSTNGTTSSIKLSTNLRPLGYFANGDLLVPFREPTPAGSPPSLSSTEQKILRVDATGKVLATVAVLPAEYPDFCRQPYEVTATSSRSFVLPNCPLQYSAISNDGRRIGYVRQDTRWEPGDAAWFDVTVFGASGDSIFTRRIDYSPQMIPQASFDQQIKSARDRLSASADSIFVTLKLPRAIEPVHAIRFGEDDTTWVWVRGNWMMLGPHGETLGFVRLPEKNYLVAASRGYVWCLETAVEPTMIAGSTFPAPGVQNIVRYRIGN